MNSWMQGQPQQPQYTSYNLNYQMPTYNPSRLPVYRADPIHGENAAWQFPMGPNSEIYLPDADEDIMWWIRTDANGSRNVVALNVSLRKKPQTANLDDILARLGAVEEWINAKSNKSNAKRTAAAAVTENQPTAIG